MAHCSRIINNIYESQPKFFYDMKVFLVRNKAFLNNETYVYQPVFPLCAVLDIFRRHD